MPGLLLVGVLHALQLMVSERDVGFQFISTISDLMAAFGATVTDPLMQYKPWRRNEVFAGYKNIKYIRDFGKCCPKYA